MIVRDPWTQETGPYHGGGLAGLPNTDPRYWLEQLHAIAMSIYNGQKGAEQALASGDQVRALQYVESVRTMRNEFVRVRDQFLAVSETVDPTKLSAADRVVVATGEWLDNFMSALPSAIAALPKAVLGAAGELGGATFKALVPWLAVGALVLVFVKQGEKSRTYRKFVA